VSLSSLANAKKDVPPWSYNIPGSSSKYSFSTLATMGISYFSSISCGNVLPVLIAVRKLCVCASGTSTNQIPLRASSPSRSG
jgi:hypothetical protein